MKKLIIKSVFVAAFVAVAGYTAYNSQKEVELSDLAMANVEALARGEVEVGPLCIFNWRICYIYGPGDEIDGTKVAG